MTPDTISQTVLFPDLFDKPLVATFDEQHASSDGGGILLKAAERVYGLVKAFAGCLTDKRAPEKIRHTLADVIGQRIFALLFEWTLTVNAVAYSAEDANSISTLFSV